jgi:hypothetical protein
MDAKLVSKLLEVLSQVQKFFTLHAIPFTFATNCG